MSLVLPCFPQRKESHFWNTQIESPTGECLNWFKEDGQVREEEADKKQVVQQSAEKYEERGS